MKLPTLLLTLAVAIPGTSFADYEWQDTEGKHLDLLSDGKPVVRFVYEAIDESSPERRDETYKPFCHVFRPGSSDAFLTKGPGGKFPHHRGIYYGFSKCSYVGPDGKTQKNIDTWHCRKAHQVHREFLKQTAGADSATFTSRIEWIDNEGKPFASEERSMTFSHDGSALIVDFDSTLKPLVTELTVDGDPQHAGFQYRANNHVAEKTAKQTIYTRPESGEAKPGATINWSAKSDTPQTRDLPWKVMTYVLDGKSFSVTYLDSKKNPKPARYSERDYGRFGSYFVAKATEEQPLTIHYRLVINSGKTSAEDAAKWHEAFPHR
jgi:hypothetical protein